MQDCSKNAKHSSVGELLHCVPCVEWLEDHDIVKCAFCPTLLPYEDTWSPGDEAICPVCDTEITGRIH